MCGRFTLTVGPLEVAGRFGTVGEPPLFLPRYNAAPGQVLPVIAENKLQLMRWGLIPFWAKEPAIGSRMINARSETAAEKPAFKASFRRKRCIIPADGYYEWQKDGKLKMLWRIVLPSRGLFGLAGLWDAWQAPDGNLVHTFTILTAEPVDSVRSIHDRMPVVLQPENEQLWLHHPFNSPADAVFLQSLLKPVAELEAYRVSTLVNSPINEGPECIQPV